jgi:Holliday junction DNA helicase RuvA
MIAFLAGTIAELVGSTAYIDVAGVGYEVLCTRGARGGLVVGEKKKIPVYTEVREDALRLFGFADALERQVFLLLLKVKGVGPKTALDIISAIDKIELLRSIGSQDVATLQGTRGIGKKTAERIVLELKDRVNEFVADVQAHGKDGGGQVGGVVQDAVDALVALGFSRRDVERVVRQVGEQRGGVAESGELVREALRHF